MGDADVVDWALKHDQDGLAHVIMGCIEAEDAPTQDEQYVAARWKSRGWERYATPRVGIDIKVDPVYDRREPRFHVADFNSSAAVELIINDLRSQAENPYDVLEIIGYAELVLPHRRELCEHHYFERETTDTDRAIMIGNILEGRQL